jgi:hypothetical protein
MTRLQIPSLRAAAATLVTIILINISVDKHRINETGLEITKLREMVFCIWSFNTAPSLMAD